MTAWATGTNFGSTAVPLQVTSESFHSMSLAVKEICWVRPAGTATDYDPAISLDSLEVRARVVVSNAHCNLVNRDDVGSAGFTSPKRSPIVISVWAKRCPITSCVSPITPWLSASWQAPCRMIQRSATLTPNWVSPLCCKVFVTV